MYLAESVIFTLIIIIINHNFYFGSFFFIGETVNPFQILSVFMSMRYGSIKGFVSFVTIFTVGSFYAIFAGNLDKMSESQTYYFFLSVLLTSHVAGQLSDFYINEIYSLKEKHEKLSIDFQKCTINYLMLTDANKELTQKIVTRFQSISTVYEAAQKLEALDSEKLYPSVLEILETHLGVKSASIYDYSAERLTLRAHIGEKPQGFDGKPFSAAGDKMVLNAISSQKPISQRDDILDISRDHFAEELGSHLIVSPVVTGGKVKAVVIVEKIAFENFTDSSVRIVNMIAEWAGICLGKIEHFERVSSEVPVDATLNCYKIDHLRKIIKTEITKAVRYRLPLSVCKVAIDSAEEIVPDMKQSVYYSLSFIIKNLVRDIDIFGACMELGCFVIILPVTDFTGASVLRERIDKEINNFKIKPLKDQGKTLQITANAYSLFDIFTVERIKAIGYDKLKEETENAYQMMIEKMKI